MLQASPMTVRDLVAALSKFEPDLRVVIPNEDGDFCEIGAALRDLVQIRGSVVYLADERDRDRLEVVRLFSRDCSWTAREGQHMSDANPSPQRGNVVPFRLRSVPALPSALDGAIGAAIRNQRLKLDLSRSDLAIRLGLKAENVAAYERGDTHLSPAALVKIAHALDTSASALLASLVNRPRQS
jgi:ribosome-binding protein aMBF1 (putative translation factor)